VAVAENLNQTEKIVSRTHCTADAHWLYPCGRAPV